jgi:hypothetical protein
MKQCEEKLKEASSLSDPNNYISFMLQLLHPLGKTSCYPLKSTVNLYVIVEKRMPDGNYFPLIQTIASYIID